MLLSIKSVACVTGSKKLASMPSSGGVVSTTASTAAAPAAGKSLFYTLLCYLITHKYNFRFVKRIL